MGRYRRNPDQKFSNHPLSGACYLCERDLGGHAELVRRPGGWVHRACWEREKGE